MTIKQAFRPTGANTVNIDVAAASARVLLNPGAQIRVMNNGTATAWIKWGDVTVAAVLANDIPVGPGVTEVLTPPVDATYVAAIAAGATGKIYFTPGVGGV